VLYVELQPKAEVDAFSITDVLKPVLQTPIPKYSDEKMSMTRKLALAVMPLDKMPDKGEFPEPLREQPYGHLTLADYGTFQIAFSGDRVVGRKHGDTVEVVKNNEDYEGALERFAASAPKHIPIHWRGADIPVPAAVEPPGYNKADDWELEYPNPNRRYTVVTHHGDRANPEIRRAHFNTYEQARAYGASLARSGDTIPNPDMEFTEKQGYAGSVWGEDRWNRWGVILHMTKDKGRWRPWRETDPLTVVAPSIDAAREPSAYPAPKKWKPQEILDAAVAFNSDYPEAAAEIRAGTPEVRVVVNDTPVGRGSRVTGTIWVGVEMADGSWANAMDQESFDMSRKGWMSKVGGSDELGKWLAGKHADGVTIRVYHGQMTKDRERAVIPATEAPA
jgi:hypothetical protein